MDLAAAGDTWGISDPAFLAGYVLGAAATWAVTVRMRRRLADPLPARPAGDLAGRPYDVAFLHGGTELAVAAALAAMHLGGTISSQQGRVRAVGRLDAHADELERAIHVAAARPLRRGRLEYHRPVDGVLASIGERLVSAGLLLATARRDRIRRAGFWMLAVAGLGLVRLLAGVASARPVGLLAVVMIGVGVIAVVQLAHAPRRTRLGDATLAALRQQHHTLAPAVRPDWTGDGPAAAALGVAVWGTGAVWASDPAFADELALQRAGTARGRDVGVLGVADTGGDGRDG